MVILKRALLGAILIVGLLVFVLWFVLWRGHLQVDGDVTPAPLDPDIVAARDRNSGDSGGRILFGDLHVHTTLSVDAFQWSLPLMGGEGVHPPADACDFARFCSQLDFYALTDHAEALTRRTWAMGKESIRQCNGVDDSEQPDLVAFTGFEWTQIGLTPEDHYGHKNVIFKETSDGQLPARPIAAPGLASRAFSDLKTLLVNARVPFRAFPNQQPYNDVTVHVREIASVPDCPQGVPSPELPPDCREFARTPEVLFHKLDEWASEAMVIPHGTTWGFYTPRGYVWDKQLAPAQDDRRWQRLVEVFSGHGNSEEYRPFRAVEQGTEGTVCPAPTEDFEACCWRAGEIVRSRCEEPSSEQCEGRVKAARRNYLNAGTAGHVTLPGTDLAEWGNCGQCTDCFNPSFLYRPGGAVQYILARGNFDDPDSPRHTTLGFIASSDNHSARPGTGYKELERRKMSDARGPVSEEWERLVFGAPEKTVESVAVTAQDIASKPPFQAVWLERQASFFLTGGLVAVHAPERTRDAIWNAISAREVYGTSGDRILLWFDLINAGDERVPMGSQLAFEGTPKFRVRAAGAFQQVPGCPDSVVEALGNDRVQQICAGECYNPSDNRRRITRIEVVRIGRQMGEAESVEDLIQDPWLTIPCPLGADVCEVEFEDPQYGVSGRELLYYVRAIQEPTPAVNAGLLRCKDGACKPCFGGYQTALDDDCLSVNEERAWSSPIYLTGR
ncbi:MAG: DUF3604 domain-containing protein [Myxococcales bacterium]|nr:DUF3604 domain-containing protein [Myxococcales bacterium]MDH3483967.1 DUF3604 domain-containing protein [Myxococcales bacterium]